MNKTKVALTASKILAISIIVVFYSSQIFSQELPFTCFSGINVNSFKLKYHDKLKASVDGEQCNLNNELFTRVKDDLNNFQYVSQQYRIVHVSMFGDTLDKTGDMVKNSSKEKSPILGGILSAIIPGAGEFYAKSYLKAAIFFAVEIASWGTYYYFQHTGNKRTTDFENYANTYWQVRTYAQWLKDMGFQGQEGINPGEQDLEKLRAEINACESQNFSHTLPDYYTQQYYELIGKYQNFQGGWTNLEHVPNNIPGSPYYYESYHDPIFINYASSRQDANNFYDRATTVSWVVILNHLLSSADAVWSVIMFNKNVRVQTGFRIETYYTPYTLEQKTMPTFNMLVNF